MPERTDPLTEGPAKGSGVAVAIATYNHAHYLGAALDSVLRQTVRPDEIIVVDDGSSDDPAAVVEAYSGVRLVRQPNQGLSAARNTALRIAAADFILFLDADDLLTPLAIEAGLACFRENPQAGFVYGGHLRVDDGLRPLGEARFSPIGPDPHASFLTGNFVGMHATALYDRARLLGIGGFDTTLRRCEDYDVYLRMSRSHGVASHPDTVALYRIHGSNMSRNSREMLRWIEHVRDLDRRRGLTTGSARRAWSMGRRVWRSYYADEILDASAGAGFRQRAGDVIMAMRISPGRAASRALRAMGRRLPPQIAGPLRRAAGRSGPPAVGSVQMGDLGTTAPISLDFGYDRGTPVDRYYIERFLAKNASDIRGRALEIGDASYCRQFGSGITRQDVLHVSAANPDATIVGDISVPGTLPDAAFDVMVLTQTLHLIYDMKDAVDLIHDALKPGGVLLLTVPGISQIDRGEWGDSWYWSLTRQSATRLFSECFGPENVTVEVHGNVYAATCYINGLAQEEIDRSKLDVFDPSYPVIVAVRARRGEAG
jgi:GT2 family glycosyltransferase/SAM-dependent methyltransferase